MATKYLFESKSRPMCSFPCVSITLSQVPSTLPVTYTPVSLIHGATLLIERKSKKWNNTARYISDVVSILFLLSCNSAEDVQVKYLCTKLARNVYFPMFISSLCSLLVRTWKRERSRQKHNDLLE